MSFFKSKFFIQSQLYISHLEQNLETKYLLHFFKIYLLGLAKIAVARREIVKIYLNIFLRSNQKVTERALKVGCIYTWELTKGQYKKKYLLINIKLDEKKVDFFFKKWDVFFRNNDLTKVEFWQQDWKESFMNRSFERENRDPLQF